MASLVKSYHVYHRQRDICLSVPHVMSLIIIVDCIAAIFRIIIFSKDFEESGMLQHIEFLVE